MTFTRGGALGVLAVCLLLGGCGQSVEDFTTHARRALSASCTSEALAGLKAHFFADWTGAQIDAAANRASVAASDEMKQMSWDLGVSEADMNALMGDARSHGQTLIPQVALTPYRDLVDAVESVGRQCIQFTDGQVANLRPRLKG